MSEDGRVVARGDDANGDAVTPNDGVGSWRPSGLCGDTAKDPIHAPFTLGDESIPTDELGLVDRADPREAGLQRRDPLAEFVAVQREAGLEAKRVTRAETCRLDNSHIVVQRGTGADAVMVPERVAFAERFDFTFVAHERGVGAHWNPPDLGDLRISRSSLRRSQGRP